MARPRKDDDLTPVRRRPPATTPEQRENQMMSYATDLAERQILDGTASSMVITHYLKLATRKEALEREKLINENKLLQARVANMAADGDIKKLYEEAIEAFRGYQPTETEDEILG